MAITIHHRPQTLSPVYHDLMFIAGSTLITQQYFKMVVKVYHGGTLQKTLKYDKWPHGNYIQADVHRMLEANYSPVIKNIATGLSNFQLVNGTFADYKVEFIEEISGNPIATGMVTATGYTFNAALKYLDWINFDYTQYDLNTGYQRKFFTNAPRTLRIREDEVAELGFISISKKAKNALITTYDASGNSIATSSINNAIYGGTGDSKSQSLAFLCGPYNLGSSVITADVANYTVVLRDESNNAVSETFTFEIDRECSRYQLFRLHFLNRWGRFDSFTFKGNHKHNLQFKRSDYQKFTGYADLDSLQWTNNSYARGNVPFDTNETEQYSLSSGWITEEESLWLQELAGSPEVYWQFDPSDTKGTIAVTITEDNYEVKKYTTKKLFNLNLTMQLAQPNYRQRA